MLKPRQHLVDLAFRDDEGRSKGKAVADDAQHQAMLVADAIDELACAASGRIARPRALVLDQLDTGDQADAGDVADQGMIREPLEAIEQATTEAARAAVNVHLLIDLEHLEGDGGRYGM